MRVHLKNKFTLSVSQVIKSEFCASCGRRTKFGKVYLRCQDCRAVVHPECRDRCPVPCSPVAVGTPARNTEVLPLLCLRRPLSSQILASSKLTYFCAQATLADFAPVTAPQIPTLVIYCIKELEHRGLTEVRERVFIY